jgi:hypothetical protein
MIWATCKHTSENTEMRFQKNAKIKRMSNGGIGLTRARTQSMASAAKKVAASMANVPIGLKTPTPTAKHLSPTRYISLAAPRSERMRRVCIECKFIVVAMTAGHTPMLTLCERINDIARRNTDSSSRRILLRRDCVA